MKASIAWQFSIIAVSPTFCFPIKELSRAHPTRIHPFRTGLRRWNCDLVVVLIRNGYRDLRGCRAKHVAPQQGYDGKPLASQELELLEKAATGDGVRLILLTERPAMERVLEYVAQGNTTQMKDRAFVEELKKWIRYSGDEAVRIFRSSARAST